MSDIFGKKNILNFKTPDNAKAGTQLDWRWWVFQRV